MGKDDASESLPIPATGRHRRLKAWAIMPHIAVPAPTAIPSFSDAMIACCFLGDSG